MRCMLRPRSAICAVGAPFARTNHCGMQNTQVAIHISALRTYCTMKQIRQLYASSEGLNGASYSCHGALADGALPDGAAGCVSAEHCLVHLRH